MAEFFTRLSDLGGRCRAAAAHYRSSVLGIWLRVLRLRLLERFGPRESFLWGLVDPSLPAGERRLYLSKRRLKRLQRDEAPPPPAYLTEDKSLFYALCAGYGLAAPLPLAVLRPRGGWSADGEALADRQAWSSWLAACAVDELVIKPARGSLGRGLLTLRRDSSATEDGFAAWRDGAGERLTGGEIYDRLLSDPEFSLWLVQERLHNHPRLLELTGCRALQTMRAMTHVGTDGRARLLMVSFKIATGANQADNFDFGRSGNLLADVDPESGTLTSVRGLAVGGFGLREIADHPQTGATLAGFRLPDWEEARSLVSAAAHRFLPVRTIGWDVAFTPSGPMLVEGNMWFDPIHNAHRRMPIYLEHHERLDRGAPSSS